MRTRRGPRSFDPDNDPAAASDYMRRFCELVLRDSDLTLETEEASRREAE